MTSKGVELKLVRGGGELFWPACANISLGGPSLQGGGGELPARPPEKLSQVLLMILTTTGGPDHPRLVISDFGCCLADKNNRMRSGNNDQLSSLLCFIIYDHTFTF